MYKDDFLMINHCFAFVEYNDILYKENNLKVPKNKIKKPGFKFYQFVIYDNFFHQHQIQNDFDQIDHLNNQLVL